MIHCLILDILKLLTQTLNNIYSMNKFNLISFSNIVISILLIMILFTSCDYGVIKQSDLKVELERAYFEGQRDYANGDKRIQWTKDSCWVWVKSPWDSGSQPIFNPSIIHSKNE